MDRRDRPWTVLTIFGTRPEVIKLAPVLRQLSATAGVRSLTVCTGQHADLLTPFLALFDLRPDHNLRLMQPGQTPVQLCGRALAALDPVLAAEQPDCVLVQGDTTTALAGALAAFYRRIPVGHVEAGLRSGDPLSPFPEEMNRRLISRLATYHFAATPRNRAALLAEGVRPERVFLTGNPVVDALQDILARDVLSPALRQLLAATEGRKRIALTTHRRESFGTVLADNLEVLRDFVAKHEDVVLIFPVHLNPQVRGPAGDLLTGRPRIHLLPPLDYCDFIGLLARSWLIVSDSGGVQEEAPTLGVPLLVLRRNTERPEAVECGSARLAETPEALRTLLEAAHRGSRLRQNAGESPPHSGEGGYGRVPNPFGAGDSGRRIVTALLSALNGGTMS